MSYCVNCGVELDDSAKKCCLCDTPVINHKILNKKRMAKPYSDEIASINGRNKKFIAYIITMVLVIPSIVCVLMNVIFERGSFWSVYVLSTAILMWIIFLFPFFIKSIKPYLIWAIDSVGIALYVYILFAVDDETGWYINCILPIIVLVSFCALFFMIWYRKKKHHWTSLTAHVLADLSLSSLLVGGVISYYVKDYTALGVSAIICTSCFALFVFMLYCNRSKHMRLWLSKKFFF